MFISCGRRAILAFSLKKTFPALIHRNPTRKYKALDGIRSFSLLSIILGHTSALPLSSHYSTLVVRHGDFFFLRVFFLFPTVNFQLFIGFDNPWDVYPATKNIFKPDVQQNFPGTAISSGWFFQTFVYSASMCVDSFFFLSGFLTALALLRRLQKGSRFRIHEIVLHRYLRLVPSFAFIIIVFSQVETFFFIFSLSLQTRRQKY